MTDPPCSKNTKRNMYYHYPENFKILTTGYKVLILKDRGFRNWKQVFYKTNIHPINFNNVWTMLVFRIYQQD